MRLLQSDAPEIQSCFSSGHYLIVRGGAAQFHGFVVNLAILVFVFTATAHGLFATLGAIGILVLWNLILIWRATFGYQNWVFLGSEERFYVRLFSCQGRASNLEPCVIALEVAEICSVSIQSRKVFVCGPKPKLYEWLAIEPDETTKSLLDSQSEQLAPIGDS